MKPARAFLQVVLSVFLLAALVVSSGFAATKKLDRHRLASEEWNDSPLMSATLLSTGSSVPSDGSSTLTLGSLQSSPLVSCPGGMDCWNGGTGNWSNAGNWSAGAPGPSSDVTIYSGGKDNVTLDTTTPSPTISSLTLGGASNGFTSELGILGGQTLTITNGLTVGETGNLTLNGSTVNVTGGVATNSGGIDLESGSTLTITGNLTNSKLLDTSFFGGSGSNTITITGTLANNAGAQFNLSLGRPGSSDVANVGILVNGGSVYVETGS